jgi:hypothetical protein
MTLAPSDTPAMADPALLKAVAGELNQLGHIGLKLQDLIGAEVRTGKLGSAAMMDAQAADLLVQHLQELAKFLEAYSALTVRESDPIAVASDTLLLGGLASRLSRPGSQMPHAPEAGGDVEMF